MNDPDPALSFVEGWRRRGSNIAVNSFDPLPSALTSALTAMTAANQPSPDPSRIDRSLASFRSEHRLSLQYDNRRNEPIRLLTYGILECVQLTMQELQSRPSRPPPTMEATMILNESFDSSTRSSPDRSIVRGDPTTVDDQQKVIDRTTVLGRSIKREEADTVGNMITVSREEQKEEEDEKLSMKKLKTAKIEPNDDLPTAPKKVMECPECKAGIVFRCDCGHESQSESHQRYSQCAIQNYTIVREKTTGVKCIQCENGIHLLCSCGTRIDTQFDSKKHSKVCGHHQFTVQNN